MQKTYKNIIRFYIYIYLFYEFKKTFFIIKHHISRIMWMSVKKVTCIIRDPQHSHTKRVIGFAYNKKGASACKPILDKNRHLLNDSWLKHLLLIMDDFCHIMDVFWGKKNIQPDSAIFISLFLAKMLHVYLIIITYVLRPLKVILHRIQTWTLIACVQVYFTILIFYF